jgi:hypothetical protein
MKRPTIKPLHLQAPAGFADAVGLDDGSFVTRGKPVRNSRVAGERAPHGLGASVVLGIGAFIGFVLGGVIARKGR